MDTLFLKSINRQKKKICVAGRVLVTSAPNDAGGVTMWGVLAKLELLIKSRRLQSAQLAL